MHDQLLKVPVYGTPAPQGSKNTGRHGQVYEASKKVKPWREAVKAAVLDHRQEPAVGGSIGVDLWFWLARPKSHFRTGANAHLLRDLAPVRPTAKPDLDKLVRSTLDALKDAGLYLDDSQVVTISTSKYYCAGRPPGALITAWRIT